MKKDGVTMLHSVIERRKRVISRLEKQLSVGTKPGLVCEENGSATWQQLPLTEQDKQRIEKELITLKSRI